MRPRPKQLLGPGDDDDDDDDNLYTNEETLTLLSGMRMATDMTHIPALPQRGRKKKTRAKN